MMVFSNLRKSEESPEVIPAKNKDQGVSEINNLGNVKMRMKARTMMMIQRNNLVKT